MGRPHIEFIASEEIPRLPVADGPFAGCEQRLLSADEDGRGDYSALVTFPAGWAGDLSGRTRPTELFVLEGELEVAGHRMGPGVYAFVGSGAEGATLRAGGGGGAGAGAGAAPTAVVFVEPEEEPRREIEIQDSNEMAWVSPPPDGAVPQGIVVKRLRYHPVTRDCTWVAAVVPGWRESRAEIHDTIEECLMLRGDILLGTRGVMRPGSYFWRPPNVEHGPMYTLNGGTFYFRSKGGSLSTVHVPVPGWEEQVAAYKAREPYYLGTT